MEKRHPMSFRAKLLTSFVIWFATFSFGIPCGFLGPSLVEFSRKFNSDVATVSRVFAVQNVAGLVGAISCGFLFNHVNRQLAAAALIILQGLATILFPLVTTLPLFFGVAILAGFTASGYDTAQIVWMIELWEGDAAAYIQTQHFSFALGAFVSPLIIKSFLPQDSQDGEMKPSPHDSVPLESILESAPLLYIPFAIGGMLCILSGLLILFLYKVNPYQKPKRKEEETYQKCSGGVDEQKSLMPMQTVALIVLSCLFLGMYCGMEGSGFQFLPTFGHYTSLHLSERDGALLLSALAAGFTVGRGIGIVVVLRLPTQFLLVINFLLICIGNSLLLFASTSTQGLVAGALLMGFGFSTVFAAFFGFIEREMAVGNVVGSIFIAVGGIISGIYSLTVGNFIEGEPFVLVYANCFSLALAFITFLLIYRILGKVKPSSRPSSRTNQK